MACRFNSQFESGDTRFLITNAMHVGPSSVLEFELVMGCRHSGREYHDEPVRLEYSTDHGMTWSLVLDGCWPPRTCTQYHSPSFYHVAEFPHWRRVTIILPISTWSLLYSLNLLLPMHQPCCCLMHIFSILLVASVWVRVCMSVCLHKNLNRNHYERISTENRRFHSNGGQLIQNFR